MDFTRAFVAVDLGEPARSLLTRTTKKLEEEIENVRWNRSELMHLTIKFLGEVDNRELPRICQVLRESCSTLEPFRVGVSGLGTFPRNMPPRIIWAGIDEGSESLGALHQLMDDSLAGLGLPREGRPFSPHLTLGRVGRKGSPEAVVSSIEQCSDSVVSHFEVDEVTLMASIRERGKVIYQPIDSVEL